MNVLKWCVAFCCEAEDDLDETKHLQRHYASGPEISSHTPGQSKGIINHHYSSFGSTPAAEKMPLRIASRVPESFARSYEVKEVIGTGSSSKCYKCTRRRDGKDFAVKVIDFGSLSLQYPKRALKRLYREVQSLQILEHENIVHMEEFFANGDSLFIVEEYLRGGELYDQILERQGLSEDAARTIFYQVAGAISYMHGRNIMHRDIKPENVLLTNFMTMQVKLIDFGFSKAMKGSHASSFLGTGGFLAPELRLSASADSGVNPLYTKSVDVWALGCLLYVMIAARMPFDDTLYERPRSDFQLKFRPERKWRHISRECKHLLAGMLQAEPLRRLTAREVLQHPWLRLEHQKLKARRRSSGALSASIHSTEYWPEDPSMNKKYTSRHEEYSEDGSCSTRTRSTSPAGSSDQVHDLDADYEDDPISSTASSTMHDEGITV